MYGWMWVSDTPRAESAGPGRSEDAMSGKSENGAAEAVPRAYGRSRFWMAVLKRATGGTEKDDYSGSRRS